MPYSDLQDGYFYQPLTPMTDYYNPLIIYPMKIFVDISI